MEHPRATPGGVKGRAGAHGRRGQRQGPAEAAGTNSRRNERERNRVKLVNLGFSNLRRYVPQCGAGKRMSKVDTLRSAVDYIRKLEVLLQDQDPSADGGSTTGSPNSTCSSEDASWDSICSEQDFEACKAWLGIE
ncbi:achaete-scute homolog 1-like [Mobula hypostoma]|uniref:achaete-scute homolog 1-like n=1 Tax=Mobula hypostoma TaxID=723540 RepID=UPI002FC2B6DD